MTRQMMTRSVVAAVAVVAGAAMAAIAGAQAGARTAGTPVPAPAVAAASLPPCPSRTVCIFKDANAGGAQVNFATSDYHSAWIRFRSVPNGFSPDSIIDNSGSDVWVYDASGGLVAGPYCLLGTSLISYNTNSDWLPINGGTAPPPPTPSPEYTPEPYQPGWFFIQYNVNTCATPPPTPLPS